MGNQGPPVVLSGGCVMSVSRRVFDVALPAREMEILGSSRKFIEKLNNNLVKFTEFPEFLLSIQVKDDSQND